VRCAGHVARKERRGTHVVIGKETRKKETTKKTRRRQLDNIRMDLLEVGWCGMDWIQLAQDRDRLRVP
jgi:hypothetical protein